jgi:Fe2+ or Zn2+ uptake regulation protein
MLLKKRDHPTADEVFARVKAEMPTISLATVYNCLETLVQCRVVRAVNFERGPTRYCPNQKPHAHFHDEQTGSTHDIDLPPGSARPGENHPPGRLRRQFRRDHLPRQSPVLSIRPANFPSFFKLQFITT